MVSFLIRYIKNITARDTVKWLIAIIISLSPAMNGIASPINSLCMHEFLLLFFLPVALYYAYSFRCHMFQTQPNYWLIFFFLMIVLFLPLSKEGLFVSSVVNIALLTILLFGYYSDYFRPRIIRAIVFFSVLASILVVVQYIGYFVFAKHITFIPYNFYKISIFEMYEGIVTTGLDNFFFRPSAFFLEPSAMARYCVLGLFCVMYETFQRPKKKLLLTIITIGILMTTSGMGIAFVAFVWLSFFVKKIFSSDLNRAMRYFAIGCLLLLLLVFLFDNVDPLNYALNRINGNGSNGYNAIEGRLGNMSYFSDWNVWDWLVGRGMNSEPQVYFTGLMTILYRWGFLGLLFFVLSLFDYEISGRNRSIEQSCLSFLILIFFTTSGVFTAPNMILFFILLRRAPSIKIF